MIRVEEWLCDPLCWTSWDKWNWGGRVSEIFNMKGQGNNSTGSWQMVYGGTSKLT